MDLIVILLGPRPYLATPRGWIAFWAREEYAQQAANYQRWLNGVLNKNLVVMEISVGFNTPGVIRWPFERLVNIHKDVSFFRINGDDRNFADAGETIEALHSRLKGDGIHPNF